MYTYYPCVYILLSDANQMLISAEYRMLTNKSLFNTNVLLLITTYFVSIAYNGKNYES